MNILMATFWKKKITGTPTGNYFKLSKKIFSSTKKVVLFILLYNSPKQRKDFRYQTLILSRSYSM